MNQFDKYTIEKMAKKHPNKAIRFDNEFLGGTDKKPFGFVPNNWDGTIVSYQYKK